MIESRECFVKERLDYIRSTIKHGVSEFDYSKSYKVDIVIKDELDKMYDSLIEDNKTNNKTYIIKGNISSKEQRKLRKLVVLYYAIYNDNLSLLSKLVNEKFRFEDNNGNLNLYALDKRFTKYFNEDELVYILKCSGLECKNFYNMIMSVESKKINYHKRNELLDEYNILRNMILFDNLNDDEFSSISKRLETISSQINIEYFYKYSDKDRIMNDFVLLMRINPMISKKKNHYDGEFSYKNLVTPSNLEIFGVDNLLKLNDRQKSMINNCYNSRDSYSIIRLKELIDMNPNFYTRLILNDEILDNLNNDELLELTPDMEEVFGKAASNHSVSRIKELVKKEFCIEDNMEFIDEDFLDSLDDSEIIGLSLKAKTMIKNVLLNKREIINKSNNKYVISKKIKGIAARDLFIQDIVSKLKS